MRRAITAHTPSSRNIPFPEQEASAHARVYDDASSTYVSRSRHRPYCLVQDGKLGAPKLVFANQWLAYAIPCQRFASTLAGRHAQLGFGVVRYTFTAEDFHLTPPAILPAHPSTPSSAPAGQRIQVNGLTR